MKIRFPLSETSEAKIELRKQDGSYGSLAQLTTDEFDRLEEGIGAHREALTGDKFEPDTEPAAYGDSVLVDVGTLRYAATALESSADRGDRYAASQIRDALREPHAVYGSDD